MNTSTRILADAPDIVRRAVARGIISAAPKAPEVTAIPEGGFPIATTGPYKQVRFSIQQITPAEAAGWLEHRNGTNRRVREMVVRGFTREMRAGEWLVNHQGIAFDQKGNLLDGQHRLRALVRSNRPVRMLVSTGWPAKHEAVRSTTMDTVDRGTPRTVVDMLELQHALSDAKWVQMAVNIICLVASNGNTHRASAALTLQVVEHFTAGIKFAVQTKVQVPGLRNAAVIGAAALAFEVDPAVAKEFFDRLYHGHSLEKGSPILILRNYFLSKEVKPGGANGQKYLVRLVLNQMHAWKQGRKMDAMVRSDEGFEEVTAALKVKLAAVAKALNPDADAQ